MSMPVIDLNSSPDTWMEVPEPDEAKLMLPWRLPSSMNSFSVLAGTSLCTTSTLGVVASRPMGVKSRTMS